MAGFSTELSGSVVFNSGSLTQAALVPSLNSLALTGSFNITGSQFTFNGTNVMDRIAALEAGGSNFASILPLNDHSASINLYTASNDVFKNNYIVDSASFDNRIDTLDINLNTVEGNVTVLQNQSYISSSTQISSFGFISSSNSNLYSSSIQLIDDGFVTSSIVEIPAGTISSSAQISVLGYITSSISASYASTASYVAVENIDGTVVQSISASYATTASYINPTFLSASIAASGFGSEGEDIPAGTISSSAQISTLGFITSSTEFDIQAIGRINAYTASTNPRIAALESFSSSLELNTDSQTLSISGDQLTISTGNTITIPTGSSGGVTDYDDLTNIPIGILSGSKTDITSLNEYTASNSLDSASFDNRILNITSSGGGTSSFDGSRIISNDKLGALFTDSVNPGTSTVVEFLDAIFYPNSGPSFTSSPNFSVPEFTNNGTYVIGTLTASDPEGQSLTFSLADTYTDNLVTVQSNGQIILNSIPTTSLFNTDDRGDGTLAHKVEVKVVDTFNSTATTDIYIRSIANTAPKFRKDSSSGMVINSVTIPRTEANGTTSDIFRVYLSDNESDNITVDLQQDPTGHFSLTQVGNYIRLDQVTSSLDYETRTDYRLAITASDEHYQAGVDYLAKSTLGFYIEVLDNITPTIQSQTLNSISENSINGAAVDTISASDTEGDVISFTTFNLTATYLDNIEVALGTYTGTGHSDPTENPFQSDSNGNVIRKPGVHINSDLINKFEYGVKVRDPYNTESLPATVTINVIDDIAPSIYGGTQFFTLESAQSGGKVFDDGEGYGNSATQFTSNQSVTWSVTPLSRFAINSTGHLTLSSNVVESPGNSINGQVTATNLFGTQTTTNFTVSITDNQGPIIYLNNNNSNLNTNGARLNNTLGTLSFSDREGDTIDFNAFVLTPINYDPALITTVRSGNTFLVQPTQDLTAGSYQFDVSISDDTGYGTSSYQFTLNIAQAPSGTLTQNGTPYIIESALAGSNIVTNTNGIPSGVQVDLGVSYSPWYKNASVQTFSSSNPILDITPQGYVSLAQNISGSSIVAGDVINTTVSFGDQYGNQGTSNLNINVTNNAAPVVSITPTILDSDQVTAGVTVGTVSISDSESDTPYSLQLDGSGAGLVTPIPQNAISSSWILSATTAIAPGLYPITASVSDSFSKVGTTQSTLEITAASDFGKFYIYTSTRTGAGTLSSGNYNGLLGISTVDSSTPPEITSLTADTSSPIYMMKNGSLGDSTITVGGGVLTLRATGTEASPSANLITIGEFNGNGGTTDQILFIYPSGSDMTGIPTAVAQAFGGTDAGDYVLNVNDAGSFSNTISGARLNKLSLTSAHEGYSEWFVLGRTSTNTAATYQARITAESGSAPV